MAPLWQPSPERVARSRLTAFQRQLEERTARQFADYPSLHRFSIDEPAHFWTTLWDFCSIVGDRGERVAVDLDLMPGARFFPDARINFAENLLRRTDEAPAIVATTETGRVTTMNFR